MRYIDNGDTITDTQTALVVLACAMGVRP